MVTFFYNVFNWRFFFNFQDGNLIFLNLQSESSTLPETTLIVEIYLCKKKNSFARFWCDRRYRMLHVLEKVCLRIIAEIKEHYIEMNVCRYNSHVHCGPSQITDNNNGCQGNVGYTVKQQLFTRNLISQIHKVLGLVKIKFLYYLHI